MNTTRTIIHSDGHTDVETYMKDADGVWIWAVTQCNGGKMYDGYVETPAQIQARFDRINANMEQLRIRDEMIAEVAPMLGALQSAVAGTFSVDDNGVDAVDAQRWQDAPDPLAGARAIALPNGQLISYATYKNTGKAQPLTAEDVDGERLGE